MRKEQPLATLIATLGTEPQVVTAALDLIRQRGERIRQVCVAHTVAPDVSPIGRSLKALKQAFEEDYAAEQISLQCCAIVDEYGRPLTDVETEAASRAAFSLLYRLVREVKLRGERVHLSIAGGRKTMAVFGMAAAQLLFDTDDCLWHLYSSGDFLVSKRLHPHAGDDVKLVPIPVALWSNVSPILLNVAQVEDPFEAYQRQRTERVRREVQKGEEFLSQKLTPIEREVVNLLVSETLSDEEIAKRLHKSRRTVEQQLRSAYQKAESFYEIEEVNRAHLISLLKAYVMFSMDADSGGEN